MGATISGTSGASEQGDFMKSCVEQENVVTKERVAQLSKEINNDLENLDRIRNHIVIARKLRRRSIIYISNSSFFGESAVMYCPGLSVHDISGLMTDSVIKKLQEKLGKDFSIVCHQGQGYGYSGIEWKQYDIEWDGGDGVCVIL